MSSVDEPFEMKIRRVIAEFQAENSHELTTEEIYWGMTRPELLTFILKEGLLEVKGLREAAEAFERRQEE